MFHEEAVKNCEKCDIFQKCIGQGEKAQVTVIFSGKATGKKDGPKVGIFLNIARRQALDFRLFRFA